MKKTRNCKQLGLLTHDAIRLQVFISPDEKHDIKELALRAFGSTPYAQARAAHAALILQARRRVAVSRTGRIINYVRSLELPAAAFMQLEACLFLIIRMSQRQRLDNDE